MSAKQTFNVKEQLKEYYETAKERLLKMKEEVKISEEKYEVAKEENAQKILEYNETLEESKKLDLILKGLQEKLILEKKRKVAFENMIKNFKESTTLNKEELKILWKETEKKKSSVERDNKEIKAREKRQIETIEDNITKALKINNDFRKDISDLNNKIEEVSKKIGYNHSAEGKKTEIILKETAEMNKFLSEL